MSLDTTNPFSNTRMDDVMTPVDGEEVVAPEETPAMEAPAMETGEEEAA